MGVHMVRQDRRTFLTYVLGAAGVTLLNACSAPSAEQAKPAAAAPTTAPSVKRVTKVSYAFASVNPFHFVPVIGSEKPDLPAKFGIEFDLVTTTNGPNAMNALVGGSVDFAAGAPDSAWPAQDKVPEVFQLMPIADGTPYVLIAQPEIKKAADLKGATLGASALRGGADTTAIRVLMFENGLKENDYTLVLAGAVSDRTAAMKAKSIQAVAQIEPQATQLRDAGFVEIDNANNYPSLHGVHSIVLVSRKSFYEGKSDVAMNFIRAWDGITKWIYDPANKDEIREIAKKTMQVGDKAADAGYNLHVTGKSVSQNLRVNEKYMQQFVENVRRAGAEGVPSDPMKYVSSTLVEQALKG
jgi:NitT/TauT family transport system substrate-binding protein